MIGSGDIGIFDAGLLLNTVFNTTQYYDKAVLGTNREFNLISTYANLPT